MPIRKSSVIVVLLMLFTFAGMSAATTYTAANVKGSYSILANVYGGALSSQSAAVGIFTFDGVSAVTGFATNIDEGILNVQTISSGSYTVSANGHGSVTASFTNSNGNPPGTWQFSFVLNSVAALVAHSVQSILINTGVDDPRVYAISANLIGSTTAATAARVKGTYSVLLNWWITGGQQRVAVGTFVFDGKSKVTSSFEFQVAEGTATTVTGTGTYTVNSNGSGSMSLLLSNTATMDFDFVMSSATGTSVAKGLQLLEVDNPSSTIVATGNAVFE